MYIYNNKKGLTSQKEIQCKLKLTLPGYKSPCLSVHPTILWEKGGRFARQRVFLGVPAIGAGVLKCCDLSSFVPLGKVPTLYL